jgi:hypothetical protein
MVYDGGGITFPENSAGLILKHGYWWFNDSRDLNTHPLVISGPVHVLSNKASDPFVFAIGNASYSNKIIRLDVNLHGLEDAHVIFGPYSKKLGDTVPSSALNSRYTLKDITEYAGTITVTSAHSNVGMDFGTHLSLGAAESSAKIHVDRGGAISGLNFSDDITVKELSLANGTRLYVNQSHMAQERRFWKISATDLLSVSGIVEVIVDTYVVGFGRHSIPLLEGPASADFTDDNFNLVIRDGLNIANMQLRVDIVDDRKILYVDTFGFIDQLSSQRTESDKTETGYQSSITNAVAWRDGLLPGHSTVTDPGNVRGSRLYYTDKSLRTEFVPDEGYDFPADVLMLDGGSLVIQTQSFAVPTIYCKGGSIGVGQNHPAAYDPVRLIADYLYLFDDESRIFTLRAFSGNTFLLDCEIMGASTILCEGWNYTGYPAASYGLTGLNTNFTGSIVVSQLEYREEYISFNKHHPTLHLYDGRNLGGRKDLFDPRALTLTHMARLSVTNGTHVTLAEDLNRGVYILEKGRFYITGEGVLDVKWPVLLSGTMWKEGDGTLILAGDMRHEDSDGGVVTDIPRASSNVFEVIGGTVKIANANALAGSEVRFSPRTAIEMIVNPDNEEFLKYGIRNVSVDTPFVLDPAFHGKLPLTIDWSKLKKPQSMMTIGIVTVRNNSQTLAMVKSMLPALRPNWNGVECEMVTINRPDEDAVTLALKVRPVYMRIIVR